MPTRDQEEEKFRKKRLKKHGAIQVNQTIRPTPHKIDDAGFYKFFLLYNGTEKLIITSVLSIFACIPIYKLYAEQLSTLFLILVMCIPFILFTLLMYLYLIHSYANYTKFQNSNFYSVTGWAQCVGFLSDDFWDGNNYAYLQVEVKPEPTASQEERKRLFDFCTHWIEQWNTKFAGKPSELNHFTIQSYFALGTKSAFILNKLIYDLSEIMKQNRPGQATVEIRFKGEIVAEKGTDKPTRADEIMDEIRQRNENERWMKD